jgi:hypothetical protein
MMMIHRNNPTRVSNDKHILKYLVQVFSIKSKIMIMIMQAMIELQKKREWNDAKEQNMMYTILYINNALLLVIVYL